MSKSFTEIARHPARVGVVLAFVVAVAMLALFLARLDTRATLNTPGPTNFVEVKEGVSGAALNNEGFDNRNSSTFDWANCGANFTPYSGCATSGGAPITARSCTAIPTTAPIHCDGAGGLFDGGAFTSNTTPPTAPSFVCAAATPPAGCSEISAASFTPDPLGGDTSSPVVCSPPYDFSGVSGTKCTNATTTVNCPGDPTVYTSAGGEKNGDALIGKGVETYATASVPPGKDDLGNVFAVAHEKAGATPGDNVNEVFFGDERNFKLSANGSGGDSHVDFELLQSQVTLVPGSKPADFPCAGLYDGHRTQGDLVLSVDFLQGGGLGAPSIHQWHCNTPTKANPTPTQLPTGTVCDVGSGSVATSCPTPTPSDLLGPITCGNAPDYVDITSVGSPAVFFAVNDKTTATPPGPGAIGCGGWACRNIDGTQTDTIPELRFLEGAVDLAGLGFTGCIHSFLPHSRSSGAGGFSSTLKDFALVPFNTCKTAIVVEKLDDQGNKLPGACFTFTPDPATGTGSKEICDNGTDTNDKADGKDGVVCTDGATFSTVVTESKVPPGFIKDTSSKPVTIGVLSSNTTCADRLGATPVTFDAVFNNKLGSLQWEKRSDVDGKLQTGAKFTVSPDPFDCHLPDTIESPILDNVGSDKDLDNGQYLIKRVCLNSDGSARTYTIKETFAPSGFAVDPDDTRTCVVAADNPATTTANESACVVGTAPDGASPDASPPGSLLPNPPNDVIDNCHPGVSPKADGGPAGTNAGSDFCDPVGKLRFTKVEKDASKGPGGTSPFTGASFTVKDKGVPPVPDGTVFSVVVTDNGTNDADSTVGGTICINNVPLNLDLVITETNANNANYVKDTTSRIANVASSGTCAGTTTLDTLTPPGPFKNVALSEVQIKFKSLGVNGNETSASIACDDPLPTPGTTTEQGAPDSGPGSARDDTDETFTKLPLGVLHCTIDIDP